MNKLCFVVFRFLALLKSRLLWPKSRSLIANGVHLTSVRRNGLMDFIIKKTDRPEEASTKVVLSMNIIIAFWIICNGVREPSGELHSDGVFRKTVSFKRRRFLLDSFAIEQFCFDAALAFGARFIEIHAIDVGEIYLIDITAFKMLATLVDMGQELGGYWYKCDKKYWKCRKTDESLVRCR